MAFPENRLSTQRLPAKFIGAGRKYTFSLVDTYEDGPVAYQDPSEGMAYQVWRAYLEDEVVWIEAENKERELLLPSPEDNPVEAISIAFNQNADLHYVWQQGGVTRLHYYDTVTSQMQTMVLPDCVTPRLTMDDKRSTQNENNDIILSYLRNDKLYFRMQRDRFGVEYLLDEGPYMVLTRMYMNNGWRLQWECLPGTSDHWHD